MPLAEVRYLDEGPFLRQSVGGLEWGEPAFSRVDGADVSAERADKVDDEER
jgi:hypothetical protein